MRHADLRQSSPFRQVRLLDDPDLVVGRIMVAGRSADILHDLLTGRFLGREFWSHLLSLVTAMRPKPSISRRAVSCEHFEIFAHFDDVSLPSNPLSKRLSMTR